MTTHGPRMVTFSLVSLVDLTPEARVALSMNGQEVLNDEGKIGFQFQGSTSCLLYCNSFILLRSRLKGMFLKAELFKIAVKRKDDY